MKRFLAVLLTFSILVSAPTFASSLPSLEHGHHVDSDEAVDHPHLGVDAQTHDTPHFRVHYTLKGNHAIADKDANRDGTPDYIERVAETLEHVRDVTINQYGWAAPPTDGTEGGNALYDVYLQNITEKNTAGYVEGAVDEETGGDNLNTADVIETTAGFSAMVLDLNQDPDLTEAERLADLQAVVAHEFLHSVQFGYDANEPAEWLWEGSADWMIGEIYGNTMWQADVFTLYDSPDLERSADGADAYAQWLFFHYLAEQHGHEMVRAIWEAARTEDGFAAVESALAERGQSLEEVMVAYNVALLTSHFRAGSDYPTVRLEGKVTDTFTPTDGVGSMGADFVEIVGNGKLEVTLKSDDLSGRLVGLKDGKASVFEMRAGQASLDAGAFDTLYLVVLNLNYPVSDDDYETFYQDEGDAAFSNYEVSVTASTKGSTEVEVPLQVVDAAKFRAPEVAERTDYEEVAETEVEVAEELSDLEPPAHLIPSALPEGYGFAEAFEDEDGINVVYLADNDDDFLIITELTEPEWAREVIDEGKARQVNEGRVLIHRYEDEDGPYLEATFVRGRQAYLLGATLSRVELLEVIANLPAS